jgi:3-methyladenine DNA glycosylase/8-oxoguanine DNA glycosylase
MSRRKAEYVVGLARLVDSGLLDLEALAHLADAELIARLTSIHGNRALDSGIRGD